MDNLRVLHVKQRLFADGATVIILNLAKQLEGRVIVDWLLFEEDNNRWHECFRTLGGMIFYFQRDTRKNRILRFCSNYVKFKKFFQTHPYNTIHIDTDGFGRIEFLLAAKNAGVRQRIIHSHSSKSEGRGGIFRYPIMQKIGRQMYKALATDYVACSELAGRWLFPAGVQEKVLILKNGIDTQRFRFSSEARLACRKKMNLKDEFLVGHIGRIVEPKNHRFLIQVFQKIYEKNHNARLLLIGSGELKPEITKKLDKMGLLEAVIMIDETTCPEKYYCAMDVFVLPSFFEGLSISAIEAQCSGLTCFLSENCSEETILTERCYRLALEDGPEMWCDRILNEKKTDIESREKAFHVIQEHDYDIRQSAEQLYALYRQ